MSTTVKLPDDLMNQLDTFDKHTDEIIEKALTAGAKIAEAQVKKNLRAVIGKDTKKPSKSTGQLLSAIGVSPVKASKGGWNIRVGFAEPRKNGKANAAVANTLEYGSKKHNQPPRPFMKPALDATKAASKDEIKRVFDEEATKYLKTKG